jgi:hypothetical protein
MKLWLLSEERPKIDVVQNILDIYCQHVNRQIIREKIFV